MKESELAAEAAQFGHLGWLGKIVDLSDEADPAGVVLGVGPVEAPGRVQQRGSRGEVEP